MARARSTAGRSFAVSGPGYRGSLAVAYLNVLMNDADQEELTAAFGRIARVTGGPRLVEKVELNAGSLYRTLCRRGNPELKSVLTLLKAMGIGLVLQPLVGRASSSLARPRRPKLDEEVAWPST